MKVIFHAFGLPTLLHKTVSATVYRGPVVEVQYPGREPYLDSQIKSVHALGIVKSEFIVVIGAGSRDKARRIALERLGRVEPYQVIDRPQKIARGCSVRPGDVILYGDWIG